MAMLAGAASPSMSPPAQVQFPGVERVVAFADVHGAYTELVTLLRETGIVDAQDHWAAGRAHVVSLGDLLDRGADSRKVMDLLMRLQDEAAAAGGQLHVVLGNHEAMNVLGDLRYVVAGGVREFRGRRVCRRARGTAQSLGSGAGRRLRDRVRPEVSARLLRPPGGIWRPGASTGSGCSRCPWRSRSTTRCSCMRARRTCCAA